MKKEVPFGFCGQWRCWWGLEAAIRSGLFAAYEAHSNKKEILSFYNKEMIIETAKSRMRIRNEP